MPIDFRGLKKADLINGKVPPSQIFPVTVSDGVDTLQLDFTTTPSVPGGTKGLKLKRQGYGSPLGVVYYTAGTAHWDIAADALDDDLVLAASHDTDGLGTYGDQLRLNKRGHGGYSKGLGLQSQLRRFNFASNVEDDPNMQTLVQLENPAGTPVLIALDIIYDGNSQARISKFGNFLLGPGDASSSAGVALFGGAASDLKGAIELTNRASGGLKWQFIPGDPGVSEGGLLVRDATDSMNIKKRMLITTNGNVRFHFGNLPQNSTGGFLFVPVIANTPSGTPTPYGGDSDGAICINDTTGNINYFVGGQWWHVVGTPGAA